MRGCADVIEPRHDGAVIDGSVERPPQEKLIDPAKAAVGVATDEIDVQRFEIVRRVSFARDDVAVKILDVCRKNGLNPVGKFFPDTFRPAPIARR